MLHTFVYYDEQDYDGHASLSTFFQKFVKTSRHSSSSEGSLKIIQSHFAKATRDNLRRLFILNIKIYSKILWLRQAQLIERSLVERVRFELTIPLSRDNGFQDRRIQPLCHLSISKNLCNELQRQRYYRNSLFICQNKITFFSLNQAF